MSCEYSYIGKGKLYAKQFGTDAQFRAVGNISDLQVSVTTEQKTLKDFQTAGGGNCQVVDRIDTVNLQMTTSALSPENLALAVFGDTFTDTGGTVVSAEAGTAFKSSLVRVANYVDVSQPVTVTDTGAVTTYVEGDDYSINSAGIYIPDTSSISDGEALEISYTTKGGERLEAILNSGVELTLSFVGLNEAQSSTPVVVDIYKAKFQPGGFGLITDDFANLELSAEILSVGNGSNSVSDYFTYANLNG